MRAQRAICALAMSLVALASDARAQAAKDPPPLWDTQLGATVVGTSGNTDTTTLGADVSLRRFWTEWQLDAAANAVRASDHSMPTAERYLGMVRGQRKLTSLVAVSAGERAERDRLAGMSFRSIADAGLTWALVRERPWTFNATTAVAWNHEEPLVGAVINHPIGLLEGRSRIAVGSSADLSQRFTYYPDFQVSAAYRAEAELTAQAAMNSHLALKVGYLWRYSNTPVPGFLKSDQTTTASIVLRWRSARNR